MEIRRAQENELRPAMDLCWRVFLEFEAPAYPWEGLIAFYSYISDTEKLKGLTIYTAWEENRLLGVLAADGSHIALFFVDSVFHRRGIGRQLFRQYLAESGERHVTVHSAPYAEEIYRRLGFSPTATEQLAPDGIRYIPMAWERETRS